MADNLSLLYPKFTQFKNRIKYKGEGAYIKAFLLFMFGMLFWAGIFVVFYRVLFYFKGIDIFGEFLASKLLSMVFLAFFSILIFSNIITCISSFFMSEELQLIISTPVDLHELYFSKLTETIVNSSWMVMLFSLPVFLSYGVIFKQHALYYIVLVGTVIPFLVICATIGIGIAMALIKLFPARRLKDVLFLLTIFLIIGMYFLFRFLRPERLVDPDTFFTVVDYLTALGTPTSPLLPSQWATDVLSAFLFQKGGDGFVFNLLLLWSTALAFVVMLNWIFTKLFFDAWSKSQEARTVRVTRNRLFNRLLECMISPFPLPVKAIIEKDIRSFFRDTAQWSQLFILSAIIIIYLYNITVLPMEKSPMPTIYLQNLISFLNLGLAGFVISAVAVRFAFPAVSMEGESFWIIKSSPLGLKRFLWCKFWVNFVLLVILAEILTVCSNYFLRVDSFMMILSAITIFLMTFGLTSLSIGCGATYPRFRFENVSQIPTSFGGLMYMILSVIFVGSIVVLEAWPVQLFMMAKFTGRALTNVQNAEIVASLLMVLLISIAVFLVPMKVGLKKLSALEEF
jgi:ABC-2 type transport system permease protein